MTLAADPLSVFRLDGKVALVTGSGSGPAAAAAVDGGFLAQ
jgi:hypothetical protein